ncbi:MAG: NAD(+)/NADH kinase [Bacteroidales bacterium]|nr:NAD(+)/NADH kinase [Bacteroidales bacterium]
MKLALYIRHDKLWQDARVLELESALQALSPKFSTYRTGPGGRLDGDTGMLLSIGGDGTFLSASALVGSSGVPILGVNLGRIGFLSENAPEEALRKLASGEYGIEDRGLLHVDVFAPGSDELMTDAVTPWPYAVNEVALLRKGAAMLGVDVRLDGVKLPTYWADGLLVATSSGSTAYSLSVGGPIVMPESKVCILSPVAPHNLNVRPLVVPDGSELEITLQAREEEFSLSLDNRLHSLGTGVRLRIALARFSLKRVRLAGSNFIGALTDKLYWGEDLRNNK